MLKIWPGDINPGTGTSILIAVAASTYLILQSEKFLSKVTGRRKLDDFSEHCENCKSKVEEVKESETLVTCKGCGSLISREKCEKHIDLLDTWRCISCKKNSIIRQRSGEWFLKRLRELTDLTPQNAFKETNILTINPSHAMQIKVRLEKVRELTEEYLAKILNGSLEDTLVGKISNDVECLPNPIPDANQHDLRRFINRICQEVVNISNSLDYTGVTNDQDDKLFTSDPRTYEQLVATAVLNKITENYHGNRNLFDISSDDVGNSNVTPENDEELILQDFEKYQSQVQNREISLPNMLDKDLNFENNNGTSWEDNWFFKISKLSDQQGLSMLVPSPTDERFKPLIGDKNVDEIIDSDNESSSSFSNFEYETDQKDEIAIKNVSKDLLIELPTEFESKKTETKINEVVIDNSQLDKEIISIITNSSPTPAAIKESDEALFESTANETAELVEQEFEEILMNESNNFIVPGSVAEREMTKWLNAAPLANNPYSSEALEKRLTKIKLRNSLLDVSSENLTPTPPPAESEDDNNMDAFNLKEDIRKYKRDYYINNDKQMLLANGNHHNESLSATPEIKSEQIYFINNDSSALQSPKLLMMESSLSMSVSTNNETSEREDFSSLTLSSDDDSKTAIENIFVQNGNLKELVTCESYEERQVIEPEVVEFLPSVKKLAKLYSHDDDFEESIESHNMQPITKSASENRVYRVPINSQPLARPVASITARSLPTKVRTELKKSLTQSDIPIVSCNERNESPDIESGVTRKSIAYFEKLYT